MGKVGEAEVHLVKCSILKNNNHDPDFQNIYNG